MVSDPFDEVAIRDGVVDIDGRVEGDLVAVLGETELVSECDNFGEGVTVGGGVRETVRRDSDIEKEGEGVDDRVREKE